MSPTSKIINSNDVQIGIIQQDATPAASGAATLVLLHGFTGRAANWEPLFAALALPGMRIIALDMLGHGQSSAPEDPARYTMQYCQSDILAVLTELGVVPGTAILLGYSMGGRIALYTAFSYFFRALVLESASPGIADPVEREQRRRSDTILAASIERDGIATFVEHWEQLPLFASQSSLPIETRQDQQRQRLSNRAKGLANSLRGVGTGEQPSLYDQLPALALPVLLIAGELDAKFCSIARQMEQQLPDATLHIVPGAGHTVHLEQPDLFVQLVKQFCIEEKKHVNRMGKST
jgi:2-succinyl-6-hydroxy-2,4-cyclohexadiene-1-carboxylate synthase